MIAEIRPPAGPLGGRVRAPSSKNYTTRYALVSALAEGESRVLRPAVQDDAAALIRCLRILGAGVVERENGLHITGFGATPRLAPGAEINPGNAGAVLRMLMGVGALLNDATFVTDFPDSLGKRPNRDLLDALAQIGVSWSADAEDGRLPVHLQGGVERIRRHILARRADELLHAGDPLPVRVSGAVSSQFVSSILLLAPLLDEDLAIEVTGDLRSRPLIETTLSVMRQAGIVIDSTPDLTRHVIRRGQTFHAREWETNGDWPGSASILSAAAVVPGSRIAIDGLVADEQGERRCLDFFASCGAEVSWAPDPSRPTDVVLETRVGSGLISTAIDGDLCTDAVLAMMATATVACGTTRITGVRNLQFKECDRVREPIAELRRVYATTPGLDPPKMLRWEPADNPDTLLITGHHEGFAGGIEVDGRGDHRVIMMLSVVGLRCRHGLRIRGAEHVSKSFPGWFDMLRALGAEVLFHPEAPNP